MISHSFNWHARRDGFSLIELLIAIFITLFLVAGMLGILVSMRGTFQTQDLLERAQENERFALTVLDNTLRNAGFFSNPTATTPAMAFPATTVTNADGTTFAVAQIVSGTTAATTAASDTVNVRFQTVNGDGLTNCLGDTNTTGTAITWTNSFAVNASNQLVCSVSTNGSASTAQVVLVDNVASMKVLYGVDTNADGSVDEYLASGAISTAPSWDDVKAVRLQMTFQSLIDQKTGVPISLPPLTHSISLMNKS